VPATCATTFPSPPKRRRKLTQGNQPAARLTSLTLGQTVLTLRGRVDPGSVRQPLRSSSACRGLRPSTRRFRRRGRPPLVLLSGHGRHRVHAIVRQHPWQSITRSAARHHSERGCGMPASSARTSVSRYRRCPPSVRMEVSFPALAHRVTVFGSTRNMVATSAGVSSGSASGVRADMLTASPPGPVLRSCVCCCASWLHWGACRGCPIWSTQAILPSPAVTSRPPGAKDSPRVASLLH
jgi:hypothetical protein